jgi:hypothetical protein
MPASHADPALSSARTLLRSLLNVLGELKPLPGLAEADRLGLVVLAEQLTETLGLLHEREQLSAAQRGHLQQAVDALAEAAHRLAPAAGPLEVARWRVDLEVPVRGLGKAVCELPHR